VALLTGTKIFSVEWVLVNVFTGIVDGGVFPSNLTVVKLVQLKNTLWPKVLTPLPMVTLVKAVHPQNARFWIHVTPLPIVTLFKLMQDSNAAPPMLFVTLSGMTMLVKPVAENARLRMVITLLPIVTLVRLVKKRNASLPIAVIELLGNMIDTIWCIPLSAPLSLVPVEKMWSVLVLADRSRATFLPAVYNAVSNCVQPLSGLGSLLLHIAPKFICMGRNTGSVVCNWII
jgi:hypothetical protein